MESSATLEAKNYEALNSKDQTEISFLVNTEEQREKVLLTSYPRSGNTLSRRYLETLSRIPTGSDCDTRRPLNKHLLEMGLTGEGQVDNTVWIVKSHYPER